MANKQETQQHPTSVRMLNEQSDIRQRYMGIGISFGIAFGVAYGMILGNKHARLAQETADKEHGHDA